MIQNNQKSNFFSRYKLETVDVKSNLLTRSLLWMSLGLMMIIFVAWFSSTNTTILNLVFNLTTGISSIFMWLINIVIIFALFYTVSNKNINILIPTFLYIFFAIYEGMMITTILIMTGTTNVVSSLLLYMLIPAAMFALMGVLGYFKLVNFTKLVPFAIFGLIGLSIMGFIMFFTTSSILYSFYTLLGMIVFIIWIGFDLQMIFRTQETMNEYVDKKEMNKLAFLFGIKLFIDFVNLLIMVIRWFGWR